MKSILTFTSHFFHYCYVLRGLLGAHFALVFLGGIGFAWCEELRTSQGIYFSLITSTTVGYGDISPSTGIGQCISVLLALIGTILFGLVVAVATQAFRVTINEYRQAQIAKRSNS
jgi:voltage-gated potassium channel